MSAVSTPGELRYVRGQLNLMQSEGTGHRRDRSATVLGHFHNNIRVDRRWAMENMSIVRIIPGVVIWQLRYNNILESTSILDRWKAPKMFELASVCSAIKQGIHIV